LNIILKK